MDIIEKCACCTMRYIGDFRFVFCHVCFLAISLMSFSACVQYLQHILPACKPVGGAITFL